MTDTTRPGPKQRLLTAARVLSYRQGVTVGLDAIIKEADVARRSVYQHFGGKDNLLAEAVSGAAQADRGELETAMDLAGEAGQARLMALLDVFLKRTEHPYFRGCRYVAADLGLPDPGHPVHARTRAYYEYLQELLIREVTALGRGETESLADRLHLVIDGTMAQRGTRPGAGTAAAARALFEQILAEPRGAQNGPE
jgi:AcrR family transcriptional regulator